MACSYLPLLHCCYESLLLPCSVRTTLEIDADVARRGLIPEIAPVVEMRDGIPVFVCPPGAVAVTSEMVRNLVDEE